MGDVVSAGAISKGLVHAKVDEVVNHRDAGRFDRRDEFLAALRRATRSSQYLALLEEQAGLPRDRTSYLRDKFYKNPNGWGGNGATAYAILRVGLIKAIEEAGDNLLLDSYWLAAAGGKVVETVICKSATQVTRIFLTPRMRPGPGDRQPRHTDKPMWVVGVQGTPRVRRGAEQPDAVVRDVQGQVVVWQRREFP